MSLVILMGLLSPSAEGAIVTTSLWPTTAVPSVAAADDAAAVELGVKFRSDVPGTITGIRFYKGATNTGTHVGKLWTTSGRLLASVTFRNESAAGWQQASFSQPVTISANTTYVASYWTSSGRYAADSGYFAGRSVDRGPLHALASGESGGNGVYRYGQGGFPTSSWNSSNYWVDVVFSYSTADPTTTTSSTTTTAPPTTTTTTTPTPSQGVQIHSTSPAQVTGAGTRTTAAFNAPAGSVLVALVSYDTGSGGANSQTVSSSPPLTWTLKGRKSPDPTSTGGAGTDGGVEIWTATVPSSQSYTVTNTQARSHDGALKVLVVTGTEATPAGALAAASSFSGLPAVSLTTTNAGSLVVAVSSDWNQQGLASVGTGQTMIAEHNSPGLVTTHMWRHGTTAGAGTAVTSNLTSPTSQRYNALAMELRAPGGTTPPPSTTSTTIAPTTTTTKAPTTTTTVAPTTTTTMPTTPPPAGSLSVRVSGNKLVNSSGSTVKLVGVNRSGGEYACVQGWGFWDGPMDLASVQAIKSWRTNAVRIPLNETCWLGINGVNPAYSGENYRAEVERYVNLLVSQGMYPILDLHWTAAGTARATALQPMPNLDHSPDFWSSVAQRFKGNPAVIFDLFNEPYPDNNSNSTAAWSCWKNGGTCSGVSFQVAGMQKLVDTVRNTGATNVILLGGVQYSNSLSNWLAYKPADPANQLAASLHTYDWNICNSETCWNNTVAPVAAQVPVVTGELGEGSGTANYTTAYMRWADTKGISYLAWTWDTWGCGNGPVLIASYDGTPCVSFGSGFKAHLATLP
jgi:hypothetical protein